MTNNRIKELRKEKNLTLKDLGKEVGLASNTISQYENGKREPKLETWQKLANFFSVSVPYLQGYSDIKEHLNEEEFIRKVQKDLSKLPVNQIPKNGEIEQPIKELFARGQELDLRGFNMLVAAISNMDISINEREKLKKLASEVPNIDVANTVNNLVIDVFTLVLKAKNGDTYSQEWYEVIRNLMFMYLGNEFAFDDEIIGLTKDEAVKKYSEPIIKLINNFFENLWSNTTLESSDDKTKKDKKDNKKE